jgi:hypothetical protein
MLLRSVFGSLVALAFGALAWWLAAAVPAEVQAARKLAGERWFQLFHNEDQVGYRHTDAFVDRAGRWHFESLTHFMVADGYPVSVSERLRFAPRPPYALEYAEAWNQRRASTPEGTVIRTTDAGLVAQFVRGAAEREQTVDWTYTLADYLSFETWLAREAPDIGSRHLVRSPNFEQGTLTGKLFAIAGRNPIGYQVTSPAPLSPTTIQLDADFAPVAMTMAGLFAARHSDMRAALAARTPLHLTDYAIPLDERLIDHETIELLELAITSTDDPGSVWPAARRNGSGWTLTLSANPVTVRDDPAAALAETLSYPISDARVQELLHRSGAAGLPAAEAIARLVGFVHGYLDYTPRTPERNVLETIEARGGECTEFADLLTTLARAAGIPARTVIGLAYSDRPGPAFAFHAWNEVAVDGEWRAVDPTWNQVRADATHMPLPANEVGLLRLLNGDRLRFAVRSVRYFQATSSR